MPEWEDAVDHGGRGGHPAAETMLVTCAIDTRSHRVPDHELTRAALDTGRFPALCGQVIAAAPLAEPDGEPCPRCLELDRPTGRTRGRGLWGLL